MANLLPEGKQSFTSSDGTPLAGGRLYTYDAGTSTPRATYADAAQTTPNTNPVLLDARGEATIFWTGSYKVILKDSTDALIWSVDGASTAPDGGKASDLAADLASTSPAAKNAGQIGFNPTLNYAAQTLGRSIADREWNPRDYPWLAKFDGVTDDAAAITACLTAIYNAGGGTMRMPRGTAAISTIAFNWAATKSVHIVGAGKNATVLQKIGADTNPVLNLSVDVGVLDTYSDLRDFAIRGNAKIGPGLRTTRNARCRFSNIDIRTCDIAWDNVGGLIILVDNCTFRANNQGYRSQKSGSIYANLINFVGGEITLNTTYGVNLGECNGVHFYGVDIEGNGTAGNTATGNVNIAANVTTEIGASIIAWHGGWLESSLGTNMTVGAASGLQLSIEDTVTAGNEAGRILNAGAGVSVLLKNIIAETPGDTVTLAGLSSTLINCTISVVTDTSAQQVYINSAINAAAAAGSDIKNGQVRGVLTFGASAEIRSPGNFSANSRLFQARDGQAVGNIHLWNQTNGGGPNVAASAYSLGASGTTSRSINAGGTVNASGADYAEYETKRDDCGVIAKGDAVGFDGAGLLTDRWAHAITFGIKSTAPSYIGGDTWFNEAPIDPPGKDGTPEQVAAYEASVAAQAQRLEAARAKVDRIAYAGKVPVNVTAQLGDYIVPVPREDGGIVALAVPEAAITFDQYRLALGQVRSFLPDGRPVVVVKSV